MEILLLLSLLQIKHWYADFKIQTYLQTVKKGIWGDPTGLSHTIDHIYCSMTALLIFSALVRIIDPFTIVWLCVAEGLIHYHIDWVKVHYGIKDMTKPLFWNQFGLDQLAHQATYVWMLWVILL